MTNTPTYHQVASQPPADSGSGWLGRLGALLGGGGTPAYLGDGQPPPNAAGGFLGTTPAYKPAPVATPTEHAATENGSTAHAPIEQSPEQMGAAQAVFACPVDPDPFGAGPIAIVIPRPG